MNALSCARGSSGLHIYIYMVGVPGFRGPPSTTGAMDPRVSCHPLTTAIDRIERHPSGGVRQRGWWCISLGSQWCYGKVRRSMAKWGAGLICCVAQHPHPTNPKPQPKGGSEHRSSVPGGDPSPSRGEGVKSVGRIKYMCIYIQPET